MLQKHIKEDNYMGNDMHQANIAFVLKVCGRQLFLVTGK